MAKLWGGSSAHKLPGTRSEMKFRGEKYYKLCRFLLSLTGLGANHSSWIHTCHIAFCWTILTIAFMTQFLVVTQKDCTIDDALDISPILFTVLTFVMKYNMFLLGFKNMEMLFSKIEGDWHDVKDQEELRILTEYSNTGRIFVILLCICIYPTTISFTVSPYITPLLDLLMPLNESRPVFRIAGGVYLIDPEKHFLLVAILQSLCIVVGSTVVISTESVYLLSSQHTQALFKIACYRIKNALGGYSTGNSAFKDTKAIRKSLIAAVEMHTQAIRKFGMLNCSWITDLCTVFERSYFFLLVMAIFAISCNIYTVSKLTLRMVDIRQLLTQGFFLITQFIYLFMMHWITQRTTDHSAIVFDEIYDTRWYETPHHIQKLVLCMMKRSVKGTVVLIGGIYSPSMEGFSGFCSSSLSYFMMLSSTR